MVFCQQFYRRMVVYGKIIFGLQGFFLLQYRKGPQGRIGSSADGHHHTHSFVIIEWNNMHDKRFRHWQIG